MSVEGENKALVRRYFDAVNARDPDLLDEFLAPDYVDHNPPPFPGGPGLAGVKRAFASALIAFPDGWHEIQEQMAEGDRVITRLVGHGMHGGDFVGIPGTGRDVTMEGISIHRVVDGKIVEHWAQVDGVSLLGQMGVLPPLGTPATS